MMLRWYLLLIVMVSWATLSEMPFEARDVASNVFIDYEANAILVGIASLCSRIGDHSCSGLDILLPSFWSRRFIQYRS